MPAFNPDERADAGLALRPGLAYVAHRKPVHDLQLGVIPHPGHPPRQRERLVRVLSEDRHRNPGCLQMPWVDAGGGTRTPKGLRPPAPKAGVSTDSTTPA